MSEYLELFWHSVRAQDNIWWQLGTSLAIFLFALLLRGLFARFIFNMIIALTHKTRTELDRALITAFEGPLKFLIVVIGLYAALHCLPFSPAFFSILNGLFRSGVVVFFAWGLFNLAGSDVYSGLSEKYSFDRSIAEFLTKVLRAVIIALTAIVIAQEWDYDVNGFLAGLGLGGLAFALAAKDALANLFGGLVIIMDKPFETGDWILTPSVEGTVEEISFRSTRVRTFANAQVTVPNSVIANQAVTNWTRMKKRRVSFHLGVTYKTGRSKLQHCIARIKTMLEKHPDVHPDMIFVRFNEFSDSSLDIFIYFFTRTTKWVEYLRIKEDVNYKIMDILEAEGVAIAFPSRSIYLENKLRLEQSSDQEQQEA